MERERKAARQQSREPRPKAEAEDNGRRPKQSKDKQPKAKESKPRGDAPKGRVRRHPGDHGGRQVRRS